jgi:alpha-ketoglutarate-dependent taurine dioxygenase
MTDDKRDTYQKFLSVKRKAVRLSPEQLVEMTRLEGGGDFPLLVRPALDHVQLASWTRSNREMVEARLLEHGAILFRGFDVGSLAAFEQCARAVCSELLDYRERAAPRTELAQRIYTSTEYPAEHHIPLHHEMSYSHNWPVKIWFCCLQAPAEGGRTPIASDREVYGRLDPALKERFIRHGVMYVRNYGEGVDLTWQDAFQTTERAVVEDYCRRSRMELEWKGGDRLRTRQVRQAVAVHPRTGDTVWFNHAHMFHSSNLEPDVRASLRAEFGEEELPRNAFYGDGSPIEDSVLDEIRRVYREATVAFDWKHGDVLLLDNFLASHGREPFRGPRQIVVAMAELFTSPDFAETQ